MEEIRSITKKYDEVYVREGIENLNSLKTFSHAFYTDVAAIYDCITRIRNVERNPSGFSIDDAPILGLLVRIWKLLNEVIACYERDNAEIISILERPLIEASVVASYLMSHGDGVIVDYRKCSYKSRLRILRDLENGSAFYETKMGKWLLNSIQEKMAFEGMENEDFAEQKKNGWRLQGKSFYQIFSEIEHRDLYAATYGMMSETIHGSWNESMDWCLVKEDDKTFKAFPFHHSADIRYVSPTLRFTNKPYRLWLQRIDAYDDDLKAQLDWIERVNNALFLKFDESYDG